MKIFAATGDLDEIQWVATSIATAAEAMLAAPRCEVFAVSRRDAQHFSRCARAGADIIGVEPDLLHALLLRAAS